MRRRSSIGPVAAYFGLLLLFGPESPIDPTNKAMTMKIPNVAVEKMLDVDRWSSSRLLR
jgi:hypothetical protein